MRSKLLKGLIALVIALIVVYTALVLIAKPAPDYPFYAQYQRRPLVMVHQGRRQSAPRRHDGCF